MVWVVIYWLMAVTNQTPMGQAQTSEPPTPPPAAEPRNQKDDPRPSEDKQGEELGKRLLRKAVTDSDDDLMQATLRLMGESQRRLEIDFDSGEKTRAVQSSILEKLNDAIKIAGKRRMGRGGQPNWTSDKRRMENAPKSKPSPDRTTAQNRGSAGDESGTSPSPSSDVQPPRGQLQETRRAWGMLPQRERDEMIQGSSELFLERYRDWIERYYRALQETSE